MPTNVENAIRDDSVRGVDPAELIFFREMTADKFFQEAERLEIPLPNLRDQETYSRVFRCCLTKVRTDTAKALAASLNIPVTDEQAEAIARNSLVPEVFPEPAPLAAEERAIAAELYFHAIKAAGTRYGSVITDKAARGIAKKMVRDGQRGLTPLRKLSRAAGCLVVVAVAGLATALALVSAAWALGTS
jgi:hypothetical protein